MQIQRKALYNLLRMNWLLDHTIDVEDWQVADYRKMPLEMLLERLEEEDVQLNSHSFCLYAENFDTPENMSDALLADEEVEDEEYEDRVYLLVFELWRRLVPEKLCVTIFCDELDHLINLYDRNLMETTEHLEDILANFQELLLENADGGGDPEEIFASFSKNCANDLEDFLNDFILDQIEAENDLYVSDLIDGFYDFIHDKKWFILHKARLLEDKDPAAAAQVLKELLDKISNDQPDLEFNFELLAFMVECGARNYFMKVARETLPLLKTEEDFKDLLAIIADFFQRLDEEEYEQKVLALIKAREQIDVEAEVDYKDQDLQTLKKFLS